MRLGPVTLQVADLGRSLAFYEGLLKLKVLTSGSGSAALGAGDDTPLVTLLERPGARPVPRRGRLGLYHAALLLPDRAALGGFLRHLGASGIHIGMADHLFSEALYLTDPDGLGVEVYADRPREGWPRQGDELLTDSLPLGVPGLLAGAAPYAGMPSGTQVGHVHFYVDSLERAEDFYVRGLGFIPTVRSFPGALFVSAGGYHHHVGLNTWAAGAPLPEPGDARLLEWRLELPSREALNGVQARLAGAGYGTEGLPNGDVLAVDPWRTAVRLTLA